MNQLRAVLMERGITVPQGRRKPEQHLAVILDGEELRLSPRVRSLVEDMREEWEALDRRIEAFDDEFAAQAKTDDAARRLASIPGIGVLNATALQLLAMLPRLLVGAISPPGSAWCRGR
jgi:transposase